MTRRARGPARQIAFSGAALLWLVCASDGGAQQRSGDPATRYAGTYPTRVSLGANSCGNVTIMDMPTVVTHDTRTDSVTLEHAGATWRGIVRRDSTFSTSPLKLDVGDGNRYVITIAGRFTPTGLVAAVSLDRNTPQSGGHCNYVVNWVSTRQSPH